MNPYAAPTTVDLESTVNVPWQVQGLAVVVKHGTVLPEVDLETGRHGEGLVSAQRVWHIVDRHIWAMIALMGIGIYAVSLIVSIRLWITMVIVVGVSYGYQFLRALHGPVHSRVVITESVDPARFAARKRRTRWRLIVIGVVIAVMFAVPFSVSRYHPDYTSLVLGTFGTGLVLIFSLLIWTVLDVSSAKTRQAPHGYLRIFPVHPDALTFLMAIEQDQRRALTEAAPQDHRKKVVSINLYRYPLKMLLGTGPRKTKQVVMLAIMKWLRSKHLVRLGYHSSETEKTTIAKLCEPCRNAATEWLAAHPDWIELYGEIRHIPDGSMEEHGAILASADLAHCINLSYCSSPAKPTEGITHAEILSFLADGRFLRTADARYIKVPVPGVILSLETGTPEDLFRMHLAQAAALPIVSHPDIAALRASIRQFEETLETHLVAKGYQSPPREE